MSTDTVRDCLAAYDHWAATYDSQDNPLIALAAVVLDERAGWCRGARVLELGCGTGRNAAWALAAGARGYVGVDASPGMLARARDRFADPRVSWLEADLCAGARAAGAAGPFDLVLICLVLEHVEEVVPVLEAARSALARGGRLLVVELHPTLHARGVGANFRSDEGEVRLPSFRHTAAELVAVLERVGLGRLRATDHDPTSTALARSPKLGRYAGRPVLLEVAAERE
jgi:SAM-dependent methyltransferase